MLLLAFIFTDFEAERNYLFENVYPLVRGYCKENHGIDFQVRPLVVHIYVFMSLLLQTRFPIWGSQHFDSHEILINQC